MNNRNCYDNNAVNVAIKRATIILSGRIQGVGFRPFVYRLAEKYGIRGYVLNSSEGVEISAEGEENALIDFINSIDSDTEKPPLAVIKNKTVDYVDFIEQDQIFYKNFEIRESDKTIDAADKNYEIKFNKLNLTIPPDIAICSKCLSELFNPSDRRYLYPFINCTDCGPRFTISKELPYDRASTSMDKFTMCSDCLTEYKNPLNRRFHAEPNGCFACGPEIEFILSADIPKIDINDKINIRKMKPEDGKKSGEEKGFALSKLDSYAHSLKGIEAGTQQDADNVLKLNRLKSLSAVKSLTELIKNGGIVCVKGIGGFHLMADAANDDALKLLRERKNRPKKPFAVMFKDIGQASEYVRIDDISADLLNSKERPICLLKDRGRLSYYVNCGLKDIGVFLPYAPLHYILFGFLNMPLVATSANIGGEPIVKDNEEAFLKLKNIADGFLIHNRDILRRCDDSVIKVNAAVNEYNLINAHNYGTDADKNQHENHNKTASYFFIRRSRGYVPEPLNLPFNLKRNVLASGAFLKNVFALAYAGEDAGAIVLSQHNGDLDNTAGFANLKNNIEDFEKFYDFKPETVVYDSHPYYENTKWAKEYAKERNIKGISLQHHRAHVISCMAENGLGLSEEVFGIAFDGTGYGDDGTIWGGEFFKGKYDNLKRIGSFKKFRLIGGEKAVKSPGRVLADILFGVLSEKENSGAILHNGGKNKKAGKYNDDDKFVDTYIKSESKSKLQDIFKNISVLTGFSEKEISIFHKMSESGLNSPLTSSCGRIFDAVSCLCGFKGDITYEGEASVYLENLCSEYENKNKNNSDGKQDNLINKVNSITKKDCFKYEIRYENRLDNNDIKNAEENAESGDFFTVDYYPMFGDIMEIVQAKNNDDDKDEYEYKDKDKSVNAGFIAEKFINTLAMIILDVSLKSGCKNVCMSGGVFQNALLRKKAEFILKNNGFNVYFNEKIPSNDGGIALGQAVYGGII